MRIWKSSKGMGLPERKMKQKSPCNHLKKDDCDLVGEICGWSKSVRKGKLCRLAEVWKFIDYQDSDLPLTRQVKELMRRRVKQEWKKRNRDKLDGKGLGGRNPIGGPLEEGIEMMLKKRFNDLSVSRPSRCEGLDLEWCKMIPDVVIRKEKQQVAWIECKVTLSRESFRDALARAFLAKKRLPKLRFYAVATHMTGYKTGLREHENKKTIEEMIKDSDGLINGIYFTGHEPFIDDLAHDLRARFLGL